MDPWLPYVKSIGFTTWIHRQETRGEQKHGSYLDLPDFCKMLCLFTKKKPTIQGRNFTYLEEPGMFWPSEYSEIWKIQNQFWRNSATPAFDTCANIKG